MSCRAVLSTFRSACSAARSYSWEPAEIGTPAPHQGQNLAPSTCSFWLQLGQTTILPVGQPELKPDFLRKRAPSGSYASL